MRCLNCKYDLRQLAEHRCPECGREFDPGDLATFDPMKARNWPALLCIAIVGMSTCTVVAINQFFSQIVPSHEIPVFWQGAAAMLDGFITAGWIVALMLAGYLLGRWRRLR